MNTFEVQEMFSSNIQHHHTNYIQDMKILRNPVLQNFLNQNGYVVLDLFNEQNVQDFLDEYYSFEEKFQFSNGVHITMEHCSPDLSKMISDKLINLATDCFNNTFKDYKLFQGSFISKQQNSESNEIHHHQDWTFVDEQNGFESYTLWIALCDITKDMGTIGVIPKSHSDIKNIRYSPIEKYSFYSELLEYASQKSVEYIELKAGQAVLWNHRLVHSSSANNSGKVRINMTFAITSKDAQLKLFWLSPKTNKVVEFNVPDNFYSINNSSTLSAYFKNAEYPENAIEV